MQRPEGHSQGLSQGPVGAARQALVLPQKLTASPQTPRCPVRFAEDLCMSKDCVVLVHNVCETCTRTSSFPQPFLPSDVLSLRRLSRSVPQCCVLLPFSMLTG